MILQYTAAALVSENKVLAHPASADSHPDEREPGGPRVDGPDRGPPRPDGPRPRRADPGDRAARARRRRSTARARRRRRRVRAQASRRRGDASAAVSSPRAADREPGPDLAAALDLVQDRRAGRPRERVGRHGRDVDSADGDPDRRRDRRARRSASCRRARTRASTTGPATTGRTPTAGRRRAEPPGSRRRQPARRSARRPRRNPFAPDDADEVGQPVRPGPDAGHRRSTRSRRDDDPLADNPFAPTRAGPAVGRRRRAAQARRCSAAALACSGATRRCCSTTTRPRPTPSSGRCRPIPRAQRLRELYPQLPRRAAAGGHHLHRLDRGRPASRPRPGPRRRRLRRPGAARVRGRRGVSRSADTRPDATSAATPEFWLSAGFRIAADDERFPVVRREL